MSFKAFRDRKTSSLATCRQFRFNFSILSIFFIIIASLSFDPKRDWGIRIGKWYLIRKVTDDDSDSDEWDIRAFIPNLPLPPIFGTDWTPDFRKFGNPQTTRSSVTTPRSVSTTSTQQTTQTVAQTESVSTSTESPIITTEATITSTESIPLTTQLITTSTESIVTLTEGILTSESVVTNSESVAASTEYTLTSTESITEPTIPSESTVLSVGSSTELTLTSVKSVEIEVDSSIESTVITTEATVTFTEELTVTTTTESPETSTEPIFDKRIEDNETLDRQRTTRKPRPASAEVIMF